MDTYINASEKPSMRNMTTSDMATLASGAKNIAIKPSAVYHLHHEFELVRDTFLHRALAKKINLSFSIAKDLPVAYWDMDNLHKHVLNNMLSNAIRRTPLGGKVAISVNMQDDYTIMLKISDSGAGIPAEARADTVLCGQNAAPHLNSNSGLYNALVCVQAHRGSIEVVNEPEFPGTTFKITLPLYSLCIQ